VFWRYGQSAHAHPGNTRYYGDNLPVLREASAVEQHGLEW
jgi:hypothetical protein